jgi:hypothetical protein
MHERLGRLHVAESNYLQLVCSFVIYQHSAGTPRPGADADEIGGCAQTYYFKRQFSVIYVLISPP